MSEECRPSPAAADIDRAFRRALAIALGLNIAMFLVEIGAGMLAGSVSLQADALDFLGDAANYAISLIVLKRSVRWRASASLAKAASMGLFGIWVLFSAVLRIIEGTPPDAAIMGWIGCAALATNVSVALILFRHRKGDSNRRSVWLCTRNDALGNVAVLIAALTVGLTGSAWPDLLVACVMAGLALSSSLQVMRQASSELRSTFNRL
jgi:cation diffusion facilitator family transporter